MTIEEKAKRYDEAIERAKKWYNAPNIDKMPTYGDRVIEEIFPELKESEDERVRKELLEHCINRRDGKQVCVDASDYRRWADWLFRIGKENIPNVKNDEVIRNEIIKFLELPHPQFVGKRHQEEWISWLEKQGREKPQRMISAEAKEAMYDKPAWNEKDEKEYKYVLKFVDNILNNCGNKKDYEHCKRCYDWLKSLKQRIGE